MDGVITIEPKLLNEAGEYVPFSLVTQSSTVKMADGTTVEENVGGISQLLTQIVGEPD